MIRVTCLVTVLVLSGAGVAAALDVTACEQTIPEGEIGVLTADLDCSSSPIGVRVLRRATLDLNGHTIAGGDVTYATVAGVRSTTDTNPVGTGRGDFTIVGPGVITGTKHPPFFYPGTTACVLLNNGRARIMGGLGPVEISGCIYGVHGARIFTQSGDLETTGAAGRGRLEAQDMTVRETMESGVIVSRLTATDVTASENLGAGMMATRRMTVAGVTANDNGAIGLFGGKRLEGTDVTVDGNGNNGVDTCGFGRIRLTNVVATGNGLFGVCGDRVALTGSTATGNASADVASRLAAPVLIDTTCGTSVGMDGNPWGVCAND